MIRRRKWRTSAAAKMFRVPSLCNELPGGLAGEIDGGERKRPPLLEDLRSDENIFPHLGSIHVPVTVKLIFNPTRQGHCEKEVNANC